MIRGYVAGPFRGPNHWEIAENIRRAERIALECWRHGIAAYCPHTNTAHFQGAADDSVWLEGHIEWMRQAEVVIVCPDGERSSGTVVEVTEALRLGIPVFVAGTMALLAAHGVSRVTTNRDGGSPAFQPAPMMLSHWLEGRR